MALATKSALVLLAMAGLGLAAYGAWQLARTAARASDASGHATARFAGYHRVYRRGASRSLGSGTPWVSRHPEFTWRAPDGTLQTVREPDTHVLEVYAPDEEVRILLFPDGPPRLAGFYSLYFRDLVILLFGLGLLLLAVLFWRFALPAIAAAGAAGAGTAGAGTAGAGTAGAGAAGAGSSAVAPPSEDLSFGRFLDSRVVGRLRVRTLLTVGAAVAGAALLIVIGAGLLPFVAQLHLGAGGRLLDALKEKRFDDARRLIEEGSGIHASDEYGQTPLLVALEGGRADLATLLLERGVEVNVRSKMLMTPLRAAAELGDLAIVRALLAKGALPQHPQDRAPPFLYAMAAGHDEVARLLIESGTDLHRRYPLLRGREGTVGDLAVLAGRRDLVELIRQRGGTFLLGDDGTAGGAARGSGP